MARQFYISWVDKRTDPFPQHEHIPDEPGAAFELAGRPGRVLPADHPEWPGVPFFADPPPLVADGRMGVYPWPGLRYTDGPSPGRLYLGPTLAALHHPASPFRDLQSLQGVFLLYPAGDPPPQRLGRLCQGLFAARRAGRDLLKRFRLVAVQGVTDPTNHQAVMQAVRRWLDDDPFDLGGRRRDEVRLVVNLSPGTPAMHACWLMLRWSGELPRGGRGTVQFVQGDGGLGDGLPSNSPLRDVPVDTLSHNFCASGAPASRPAQPEGPTEEVVSLEELAGPPFDALRQKLDQAALLGLPVLLQGERGTGKTFLARYYHERRRSRRPRGPAGLNPRPEKKVPPGVWLPRQAGENAFVAVTLSEYSDLDNLRDTLFGWAEKAWNLADEPYDGLLGQAHGGTLFLDEIHHLPRALQAALLGPLNNRRYRPKMAVYELHSAFDLVIATNDPEWRSRLADDFRDRIERIVLEVPSFRSLPRDRSATLLRFWDSTLRRRCAECGIAYTEEGEWGPCREALGSVLRLHPLPGNWRDLQRLADNLLLALTPGRDGNPPPLEWRRQTLEAAIAETFS